MTLEVTTTSTSTRELLKNWQTWGSLTTNMGTQREQEEEEREEWEEESFPASHTLAPID